MAKFNYKGIGSSGKPVAGTIDAENKQAAMDSLNRQSIKPLSVSKAGGGGLNMNIGPKKVKLREMVVFTRQLSTMISAGVPLAGALSTLGEQTEDKYFKEVISDITKDIEGGTPLADAFEKHPKVFTDVYVNMVRAGETGGILDDILKRLATQVEKDASMKKKIKSAMTYPTVIMVITIIAFFVIMMFVMPKMGKIIEDLGGPNFQLPIYTRIMLGLSNFMQKNALLIFISSGVGIFLFRRYIKTPKGKLWFHGMLLKTPIVKTIVSKVAIARFSRTFASLTAAGVPVLDTLAVTGGAIGNKVIEADLMEAAKEVKNGRPLSEPLSKSKHFPQIVGQMLAVGEETGKMDTILVKVADFYEEEVDATVEGLTSIIEPVMIVVLGAFVGVIAASVMGPMAQLTKSVGG